MLGTLRLMLALAVAASHAGVLVGGLNPGVTAVVGFYLISGYVMAGLIQRYYSQPSQAPAFYLDRAFRLLPQYLFYCGLILAWQLSTKSTTPFLDSVNPGAGNLLNNLLIVPLNYYMYNGSDRYTLIPPAWSLGAEVQFYFLAPFLLLWTKRILFIGFLSLIVYLAALGGFINSDWFGYRLLPGVLIFFVLGALLARQHQLSQHNRALAMTVGVTFLAGLALVLLYLKGTLRQPYNFETLFGLMLGLLLLHTLATRSPTRWDELAGNISYGVFLNHFLIIWVLYPKGVNTAQLPGFLVLSMVFSWLSQRLVEQPLLKFRYRFRKSPQITPG
jgi:peptidoglycan/LPS O-acetylase OafA/YrhL